VSSTKLKYIKTVCSLSVKHVQIKLPTSLVISGGWLCRVEREWQKDSVVMRKRTAPLRVLSRNAVRNAKSGKARISIAEAAGITTGYNGGAKNARVNTPASVTSGLVKVRERISGMRTVIGSSIGSKRSNAGSVENGKRRVSIINTGHGKTA
jgi:hypothetical protein